MKTSGAIDIRLALAITVVLFSVLPHTLFLGCGEASYVDPCTGILITLNTYGVFLREYANQHAGRFPAQLSEVAQFHSGPLDKDYAFTFHDPESLNTYDWLYFDGYTTNDSGGNVLVASPRAFQPKEASGEEAVRPVVLISGAVARMPERAFREMIKEQRTALFRQRI